jgi:hypothetical protein
MERPKREGGGNRFAGDRELQKGPHRTMQKREGFRKRGGMLSPKLRSCHLI